ncbi:MAG: ATP-binding cassette domain-containing protein [Muribaculaceae bacterium]|nr:ATP-binding cassette domain-containing protein [Muribaculaceae bacterium]
MKSHDSNLITLHDVGMTYDRRVVLENVNAGVSHGDFVAITGPNGGGKTTLLRIVLGLLHPTAGSVEYCGGCTPSIGYLPQKNSVDAHFPITVEEVVATGLLGRSTGSKAGDAARVEEYLRLVDMADYASQPIGRLSGGQVQRTLLARALVSQPSLIVMDEPLSYLDKHFESRLYDILEDLRNRATILLVSHEMNTIDRMATHHWIVDRTLHQCTSARHWVDGCDHDHD